MEARDNFPNLRRICGEDCWKKYEDKAKRSDAAFFDQMESDLAYLRKFNDDQVLIAAYRGTLKSDFFATSFEIYTAALIQSISDFPLHLQKRGFEFQATVKGTATNVEVKSLWDPDLKHFTISKAGAVDVKPRRDKVHDKLREAHEQLPEDGFNLVVLGLIEFSRELVYDALYGTSYIGVPVGPDGPVSSAFIGRDDDGFFADSEYARLYPNISAVIPMELQSKPWGLRRWSELLPLKKLPWPKELADILIKTFDRKRYLEKEKERIVESIKAHYSPEKIILFGSLASGDVHEWSDIDLVVIKETTKPYFQRLKELALLVKPKVGVNFFVYTPEEFRQMQEEGRFFILDEVIGKGKLIYDRSGTGIPRYPLGSSWEKLSMEQAEQWLEYAKSDRDNAELLYYSPKFRQRVKVYVSLP